MSWSSLEEYMKQDGSNKEEVTNLEKELITVKANAESKTAILADQKETILDLRTRLNNNENKRNELAQVINKIEAKLSSKSDEVLEKDLRLERQNEQISSLKSQILERKNDLEALKVEINDKLTPLNKIEKTFFGKTGNKGKGELGEMQLKTLLQKSGLDENIWQENLVVGKNNVEFAIQSGNDDGKWIPIDSKVLDAEYDEDSKLIVDEKYKKRVLAQVKSITKYLGKSNTAEYGLLVLQSDSIYMTLYNEFPSFFKEVIEEHKVYITSPSSFVQITWSIANIIKIYERVHKDKLIYDEMISVLESITKFSNKMAETHKAFNIAMTTHYPTIQKKQEKLVRKLEKEGKIKELPVLN
ncbi:DNA recombination protein RmuC [Mycoplasma marinum]